MENNVIPNSDSSAYFIKGMQVGALVTLTQPQRATLARPNDSMTSSNISPWGDDNAFPQNVIKAVRKDHELGPLLNDKALLIYAGGLTWGIPKTDANGNEILEPLPAAEHQEIAMWMRRSNINRYLMEAAKDMVWFQNSFPELVLQTDRSKIIQLCAQPAESCRWEVMNEKGIVSNCYINLNFPDGTDTDKYTKKVPTLDPYFNAAANLKLIKSGYNFIYPLSMPSPGCTYYQIADWNGLRESGWLAVSQAIPKFKINILEKQLNIKYHVEISDQFWLLKYPKWETLNAAEKSKLQSDELKTFSDVMKGVEGKGNSLITTMKTDFAFNKEYSLWKISVIDNKLAKGEFIEELKEASLAKMAAVGLHPALSGTMPSDGMGGSGTNIREAYNLNNIKNRPIQDVLLEPLNVVRDYNGWNPFLEFRIKNPFMTTLNTGTETKTTMT